MKAPLFCKKLFVVRRGKMNSYEEQFSDSVDLSQVSPDDRIAVHNVVRRICKYQHPMPLLSITAVRVGDDYNINIKGWAQVIDFDQFYRTFRDPQRDTELEIIFAIQWWPVQENGGEGGMTFKVHGKGFDSSSKRTH